MLKEKKNLMRQSSQLKSNICQRFLGYLAFPEYEDIYIFG